MQPFNLHSHNTAYIEDLYEQYRRDPDAFDPAWAAFFKGFDLGFLNATSQGPGPKTNAAPKSGESSNGKGVHALVQAYRQLGHFAADLDPLGHSPKHHPLLELSEFGLTEDDLNRSVGTGGFLGQTDGTLRGLRAKLKLTYCQTLGMEYTEDKAQRDWLVQKIEPHEYRDAFPPQTAHDILQQLVETEAFEQFLHTRYIGQKRFSVEGSESLLPLLHTLVGHGSQLGIEEMVIGMSHRGRINVLAHLLNKPYEVILSQFEGSDQNTDENEGDVKYHQGYSYDHVTPQGRKIHLSLSFNPSHLELVDPVIEGMVQAKQDYLHDTERSRVIPVQIHGEAAFTGQGIVAETLNLSQLEGYQNGGTIHIIVNNQLGYTATPKETRFTPYPTDVAKQVRAPVFHVNANDPEAVVHAARLAIEFRQRFKRDVLIDLWCYRRHGHNEADDPTLTQPLMYQEIEKHPTVVHLYTWQQVAKGNIEPETVDDMRRQVRQKLDRAQEVARKLQVKPHTSTFGGVWQSMGWAGNAWNVSTGVDQKRLDQVKQKATCIPPGFTAHRTVQRMAASRAAMIEGKQPVDWGCAEILAFGTLLLDNVPVRLTGQDSQRGTFAHRHAVWHDIATGEPYVPLSNLGPEQAEFVVLNTMLSELAVLGFEYGISSADPRRLVIWEAQFGDFVNGAQLILDQFICSAETKWQRMSGIVLLLPHGYEGMGPEHSSARLERFLQLCAKNNMQVCYPTTPAQLFHVLRRQMHRNFRKPLILMTPKSLLRHKLCVSPINEFIEGSFCAVIDDVNIAAPQHVRRILLCSGKIYYDLLEARIQEQTDQITLIRVEQLYPFPAAELEEILARYPQAQEVYWVQEESQNMGAWTFVRPLLEELLAPEVSLSYVGRDEAASPATGIPQLHQEEQEEIITQALAPWNKEVMLADIQSNSNKIPASKPAKRPAKIQE